MKLETNVFTASDGVTMRTYFFSAASTLLFLQKREDGWYHWRDHQFRSVVKLRLPIDATLEEAGRKVVGMLIEHLKVSLQMAESRLEDFAEQKTKA